MRAEDVRELTDDEIRSRIAELQDERFRLRFRAATQALEDPLRLRIIRKDVARMQTVLRQRALGIESQGAAGAANAAGATSGRRAGARTSRATRKTKGTRAGRAQER
jgi:large subunit ribosomal protein L29